MNILMATSEAAPFAKTGGLADVCGALPVELARLGHETALIMPCYRQARACGQRIEPTGVRLSIHIGSKIVQGAILRSTLPDSNVPVYLIEQNDYFDREELYRCRGKDYVDNCERFVFFCRAAMEAIRLLDLRVDVLHANDWQTGLLPAYLAAEYRGVPGYEQLASLFTIHNLAYQGQFWHWDMLLTGLDWKYFNWQQMEFYGSLNLLKTGLVFADAITTVSPRYAEEIQSGPLGCGLDGVLRQRRDVLSGILNGVDYGQWNPAADPHLPRTYDAATVVEGKRACKAALQQEFGLPQTEGAPLLGFVGRLSQQKGLELIAQVMQSWLEADPAQWVFLGTGEPQYHELLTNLARRYPHKVGLKLAFSEPLAHRVEAGSDLFLMPSEYEPCGLNQLYSLKYGTVPVVRATGGLADTVVDCQEASLAAGNANGFSFHEHTPRDFGDALRRAAQAFARPEVWRRLQAVGMAQDWSWGRSAKQYAALFERVLTRRRQRTLATN